MIRWTVFAAKALLTGLAIGFLAGPFLALPLSAQERLEVPPFEVFGSAATPEDAAAVEAVMQEFRSSWADQDTDRLLAVHAEDVEWINAYARIFRGHEALGEFLEERLFPAFDPTVSRTETANMTPISVRYVGDDAAVVHWYTDGNRGQARDGSPDLRRTHLHFVLEKADDEWKIVHEVIFDAR